MSRRTWRCLCCPELARLGSDSRPGWGWGNVPFLSSILKNICAYRPFRCRDPEQTPAKGVFTTGVEPRAPRPCDGEANTLHMEKRKKGREEGGRREGGQKDEG